MKIRYAILLSVFSFFGYSQTLIHYWHFNNLSGAVDSVQADYSALSNAPWISFPGTGAGFLDDVNDGDTLNLRMGQTDGRGLRVRNPSDTRMLMIPMPTTDFEDIQFSYAAKRTNNGAQKQWLSFSTDNGQTWSNAAPFSDTVIVGVDYDVESFDFSSISAVNDNPNFWVRIEFFSGSDNSSGNNRLDNIVLEGTFLGGGTPPTASLIHYWHFNSISGTVQGAVNADYSRIPNLTPGLQYVGSGDGFMDEFSPGSSLNLQRGEPAGLALRVRNPSFDRALIIELPTTECSDIVLMYDAFRSGAGMLFNNVAYTVDGVNYDTVGMGISMVSITESYQTFTFDFSGIAAANDNPNFKVRITWSGNTNQPNGNNRYDNIVMFAGSTTLRNTPFDEKASSFVVFPQPASDHIYIRDLDAEKIQLLNMNGVLVLENNVLNQSETRIDVSHLPKGSYLIRTFKGASLQVKRIVIQ